MQIGFVLIGNTEKLKTLSKIAERKLVKDGHTIKYFSTENSEYEKLCVEKHVIFFMDSGKIFSTCSSLALLEKFLKSKGNILTRYASLFATHKPFGMKTFLKALTILENYGFVLQDTDVVKNSYEMNEIMQTFTPAES